ncbi:competence/damage-inducible protein A [Garciella nitratireducens]|uniref:Putative competence-damage inducible protein n=1 Tax=Garciella nitratireducens DSM 15102 TaxID=1121911 RepID=A0A1T4JVZ4_9FIRM|nr:competence/damage-inducible protein A [Garciella nitratireducens]RBP36846.1 competence/damage-inducible protein cinA [Garciella nitratireducens]SJZ34336.1 nicotinamide-nucleotide amidase [Garciella nitratireducens DSM 15102]
MNGEIISIGTELLLGDVLNSNSQYLSKELSILGINLFYHSVVGDNAYRLKQTLLTAFKRSDIIITTGGLGPTQDDLTKETISKILNLPLELHQPSLKHIENYFKNNFCKMTSNNIKQAYIPKGSIAIPNHNGTAPGIIIEKNNKIIILLPGPPKEMIPMFEKYIISYLSQKQNKNFYSKYYRVVGIGESALEDLLLDIIDKQENPTLATYAGDCEVLLRLTANAKNEQKANKILQPYENFIYNKIGQHIYGGKEDTLEKVTADLLLKHNITFSIAESCTGGLVASRLTSVPKISKVFHSGIVCYSNQAKKNIVGVSKQILEQKGAVSPEIAEELCKGLYNKTHTDIVMSITGIAGPEGGTIDKPIGLVYIGLLYNNQIEIYKFHLKGERKKIQKQASQLALNIIRKKVLSII